MSSQNAPRKRKASTRALGAASPPKKGGERARKPSLKLNLTQQADEERQGALDQRDPFKNSAQSVAQQTLKLMKSTPAVRVDKSSMSLREQDGVDDDDVTTTEEDEGDIDALLKRLDDEKSKSPSPDLVDRAVAGGASSTQVNRVPSPAPDDVGQRQYIVAFRAILVVKGMLYTRIRRYIQIRRSVYTILKTLYVLYP